MFLNEEFLKIYEELGNLTEEVSGLRFNDIIVDNNTLLDYINIDETRKLNNNLPENPNNWRIIDRNLYVISNPCLPTCTMGFTKGGQVLKGEVIKKRLKNYSSTLTNKEAAELVICNECNKICGQASGKGNIPMASVSYDCTNGLMLTNDPNQSIWKYLNKDPNTAKIPEGHKLPSNSKNWPPFKKDFKYTFTCPKCSLQHVLSSEALVRRVSNRAAVTQHRAPNLALCIACFNAEAPQKQALWTTLQDSRAIEYLDKTIFKSTNNKLILTAAGSAKILELNNSQLKNLDSGDLAVIKHLEQNKEIDIGTAISKTSRLIFPFTCNNKDCIEHNNGETFQYTAAIHNVNRGVYHGCSSCRHLAGACTSISEKLLRVAVEYLFEVKHIIDQPKIKPYHDIDVLFKYQNKGLIGIEYDGAKYHQDERTIQTDILKTEAFKNIGVTFIRVREKRCRPFISSAAYCTNPLTTSLGHVSFNEFKNCLTQIGQFLTDDQDYKIPEDKLPMLKQLHKKLEV